MNNPVKYSDPSGHSGYETDPEPGDPDYEYPDYGECDPLTESCNEPEIGVPTNPVEVDAEEDYVEGEPLPVGLRIIGKEKLPETSVGPFYYGVFEDGYFDMNPSPFMLSTDGTLSVSLGLSCGSISLSYKPDEWKFSLGVKLETSERGDYSRGIGAYESISLKGNRSEAGAYNYIEHVTTVNNGPAKEVCRVGV